MKKHKDKTKCLILCPSSEDIYSKFHKEEISTLLTLAKKKIPVKLTTVGS
jgi:vesicle coat complex subunit